MYCDLTSVKVAVFSAATAPPQPPLATLPSNRQKVAVAVAASDRSTAPPLAPSAALNLNLVDEKVTLDWVVAATAPPASLAVFPLNSPLSTVAVAPLDRNSAPPSTAPLDINSDFCARKPAPSSATAPPSVSAALKQNAEQSAEHTPGPAQESAAPLDAAQLFCSTPYWTARPSPPFANAAVTADAPAFCRVSPTSVTARARPAK
jgi:hypothetical protein